MLHIQGLYKGFYDNLASFLYSYYLGFINRVFTITGASFLLSSNDLVFIFLSIELQSYGLYLICTIYRSSESATSGGLTYFLLGGLSSCFILLGQSLLYSNTSVTCLDGYYLISSMYEISYNTTNNFFSLENSNYLNISLLIICVGFFLSKCSSVPFLKP